MPARKKVSPSAPTFLDPSLAPWVLVSEVYWMADKLLERRLYALRVTASQARALAVIHSAREPVKPAMNHAAEIKLRAERRCGEKLKALAEEGTLSRGQPAKEMSAHGTFLLDEHGISRSESSRWQKLADADPSAFEQYIAEAKESGTPITTAGVAQSRVRG